MAFALQNILQKVPELECLPKDPRTFLNTPRKTITRVVEPGVYCHLGLYNGFKRFFNNVNSNEIPYALEVGTKH